MAFLSEQTQSDMKASGAGEPTLLNFLKALMLNPSFETIYCYRLYSRLFAKGGFKKAIARLIRRRLIKTCGCDISPECLIGQNVTFKHPHGVVIGRGAVIKDGASIYQNVTLGNRKHDEDFPVISEGVVIFAGASVLGDVTIGKNAKVGAGSVVLDDVPDNTTVVGTPAKPIKSNKLLKAKAA